MILEIGPNTTTGCGRFSRTLSAASLPVVSAQSPSHRSLPRARRDGGSVLVEFALVSLVLYIIFAATISLGHALFAAQTIQDAARVAARELALTPLAPDFTFEDALATDDVRLRIFDRAHLVIDLDAVGNLDVYFAGLPLVNQMLRPVMIYERIDDGGAVRNLLRYPGALIIDAASPSGFTVAIPRVVSRAGDGTEVIEWLPVIEEIRTDTQDPTTGPFSVTSPALSSGIVALRINYPYQSSSLSAFQNDPGAALGEPNLQNPVVANDGGVQVAPSSAPAPGPLANVSGTSAMAYDGPYGLGLMQAVGTKVRPFRKLLSGQAIYRREVFQ